MAQPYSQSFKERRVRRLTGPDRISATALAEEVGVSQTSLSDFLNSSFTHPLPTLSKTSPRNTRGRVKLYSDSSGRPPSFLPTAGSHVVL